MTILDLERPGGMAGSREAARLVRPMTTRTYLMCPPAYFDVSYAINPWMNPSVPVDRALAMEQWRSLVDTYRAYGHRVVLLDPVPGLPDLVFAANGATMVDGRVLLARFANAQRSPEADVHAAWHRAHRRERGSRRLRAPQAVNEAEGDFAVLSDRVLAGFGFRTAVEAHHELASLTRRRVISLELVDPLFYHLDVALMVLDDLNDHIAYYPGAFSVDSRRVLERLFPDAVQASLEDARALGLNGVSDGRHVFIPTGADRLTATVEAAGYQPVPIDLSEFHKSGGSVKCCTQELRPTISARIAGERV